MGQVSGLPHAPRSRQKVLYHHFHFLVATPAFSAEIARGLSIAAVGRTFSSAGMGCRFCRASAFEAGLTPPAMKPSLSASNEALWRVTGS